MKDENNSGYIKSVVLPSIAGFFRKLKDGFRAEKVFSILFILSFFVVIAAMLFTTLDRGGLAYLNLDEFAVGRVAERDVVADRAISYTDQAATEIRKAARLQTIAPIFRQDTELVSDTLKKYDEFVSFTLALHNETASIFEARMQEQYPGFFNTQVLKNLQQQKQFNGILSAAQTIVKQLMAVGIAEFPEKGLEGFNQSEITLLTRNGNNREYINIQTSAVIKKENLDAYIKNAIRSLSTSLDPEITAALIRPFLQPTIIYDEKETEVRVQETLKQVQPVIVTIQKNQKIIKRGFIITAENYRQLQAYSDAGNYLDLSKFLGLSAFILCLYIVGAFMFSLQATGERLQESRKVFLLMISLAVYLIVLFTAKALSLVQALDIIPFIPAALTAMLVATLISTRIAIRIVFLIMLIVLTATGFKLEPALFALFSGLSAVSLMNLTGRRMDLIKTACQLAVIHPIITFVLCSMFPDSYGDFVFVLFGSVINGFISGIFVLGFLPILEDRMNTPTCFRLMELSDLNSPTMKQMLLTASGTYNHTMMVATLAEAACREIGADALLARVGAYYHDIGKMANSEYFVENQTSYNKHLDLNPRLSAAIIRSHVKIGVEKAESMRLPREVIDIIGQHHGNSLVQYFYAKAKELDPNVSPKDFSYPGQPPRTKEAAVVMLADVSEAACRTLDHPSVPRLEKFIAKLVKGKMESGQLDNCDLTLRELRIIQESFVTTLAGYYHSRIKYPNQKDPDEKEDEGKTAGEKNMVQGAAEKTADEKSAESEAASEKESEKKLVPQGFPVMKGISPGVKNYLEIDLGLESPETSASEAGQSSTAAPEQTAALTPNQQEEKDNKEERNE
ncbi:7TM receptor with intracellular HD hydrolase [Treponema vincentii ATCC 35580]|uniref:7TM receptor with intracellular HD hydrolase n=1 Tax=Treponema vincentii ATCC 35580 TaxID=596324 RepID=C8PTB9_9SPIR|nr:HDIG domain-containing metalloprotein [Treponema vincentii]EEV19383.1 7TM receptor with intracellular HD hydrolase [Treponema vincentii ATCC 35580]